MSQPKGKSTSPGNQKIGVIGFPFSKGQPKGGTEKGPNALRDGGLFDELKRLGNDVTYCADVVPDIACKDDPNCPAKNHRAVGAANRMLADAVASCLKNEQKCLVLGGDHSLGVGSIAGQSRIQPDLVVIWVDAHGDLNTPLTSDSGNIHGMPLSFLVKELQEYLPVVAGFEWCKPTLSAKDLIYIGLRDVDPGERAFIEKFGITCFSMQEVDELGIKEIMKIIVKQVGNRPIHLSFDVDGMDPAFTPATGTAVPGGLTLRESLYIAEEIYKTGQLHVLDIAEVNPDLSDEAGRKLTVDTAINLIGHFFGKKREGNIPKNYNLPKPK